MLLLAVLLATPSPEIARARSLEETAFDLQRAGKYVEAEKPLEEAIAIWKKLRGPEDIEVLNDEINLAASYRRRGDAMLAVDLLERVIKTLDASRAELKLVNLRRSALNNLAVAYLDAGRYDAARRTLGSLLEGAKGPPSDERARVLDNLANVEMELRQYERAEKHARLALADWRAMLGEEARDVAISMSVVGTATMLCGRLEEARPLLEGAVAMAERQFGRDHPTVGSLSNLMGKLDRETGHFDSAEAHYRRALALALKSGFTKDHPIAGDAQLGLRLLAEARAAKSATGSVSPPKPSSP
jgi:tetratricopeptide (TPR) repeat protein